MNIFSPLLAAGQTVASGSLSGGQEVPLPTWPDGSWLNVFLIGRHQMRNFHKKQIVLVPVSKKKRGRKRNSVGGKKGENVFWRVIKVSMTQHNNIPPPSFIILLVYVIGKCLKIIHACEIWPKTFWIVIAS